MKNSKKAAVILTVLGEDVASSILKQLNPEEIKRIGAHMQSLKRIDEAEAAEVLLEFRNQLLKEARTTKSGKEVFQKAITKALGNSAGDELSRDVYTKDELHSLELVDDKTLAVFLQTQRPQTVALVCAFLPPDRFRSLVKEITHIDWAEVFVRIANLGPVAPETLEELDETLKREFSRLGSQYQHNVGGSDKVAKMLAGLDSATQERMLAGLKEKAPDVGEAIEEKLFVFADLIKIDDRGLQVLINQANPKTLLLSLKRAPTAVAEKLFANMSERAAETMRDDLEALPKVRLSEVEEAQREIIDLCRKLESEGKLVLNLADEQFV